MSKDVVFETKRFKIIKDRIKFNDGYKEDYVIETPVGASVLGITKDNKLILIEEYRSFTKTTSLNIPGGGIEEGENPVDAARRELLEETGYTTDIKNFSLLENYNYQGWLRMNIHFFLAKNLVLIDEKLSKKDPSEKIKVVLFDVENVFEDIAKSDLTYSPFLLYGIALLKKYLKN